MTSYSINMDPQWESRDQVQQVDEGHKQPMVRVRMGGERLSYLPGGAVQRHGTVAVNTSETTAGGDIRSTAKRQGTPVGNRELKDDDTVEYGGMEVSVAVAKRMGILGEDGRDQHQTQTQRSPEATAKEPTTDPEARVEPLAGKHTETYLKHAVENTDAGAQVQALNDIIETGEVSKDALGKLASGLGFEPHQAHGMLTEIRQGFERQADRIAESYGVDPEAVWEHARKHSKSDLDQAMRIHAMNRDTSGYAPLVQSYLMSMAKEDPEAILGATMGSGIKARRGTDGKIILDLPGYGSTSFEAAVKAGLIRTSRVVRK